MAYNKNQFDEIDKLFDSVFKENSDVSVDDIRKKISGSYRSTPNVERQQHKSRRIQITRPSLSKEVRDKHYDSRFAYFECYITNIDYPNQMNDDYQRGFHDSIDNYYKRAQDHKNNLVFIENLVHDELRKFTYGRNTANLYNRGYSNGLEYVEGSLKKSKKKIEDDITKILGESIFKN